MDADEKKNWERETIRELLHAGIKERRAARRWGVFFKFLFIAYIAAASYLSFKFAIENQRNGDSSKPFVAVVELAGPIMSNEHASADNINKLIDEAFTHPMSTAVILKVNSPGGSVVQSNKIFNQLQRFKHKYPDKKLLAVIDDVGASGAYWISCAADQIYADQASIVGSIGVLVETYGLVKAIEKIGVERRVYSAGENKVFLDPFLPVKPEHQQMLSTRLQSLHTMFIELVKSSRGARLAAKDYPQIFSGEFWLGKDALQLGLIDGIGDVGFVAQEVIGMDNLVEYNVKPSLFKNFAIKANQMLRGMAPNEISLVSWLK